MPTVELPLELRSPQLDNPLVYSTAALLARPGRSMLTRILEECRVDASEAQRWCILDNMRERELDEPALQALDNDARVHLSLVGAPRPPRFVELRLRNAGGSHRDTQNFISAEPRHDFLHFLGMCVHVLVSRPRAYADALLPLSAATRLSSMPGWSGWTMR